MTTCEEFRGRISPLFDGELPPDARESTGRHLAECASCRSEWTALSDGMDLIAELPRIQPPAGFADLVVARAKTRRTPWMTFFSAAAAAALLGWLLVLVVPANSPTPVPASSTPDEDRLREAWPLLVETWNALDARSTPLDPMDDNSLRLWGKVHTSFSTGGFIEENPSFEAAAVKQLFLRFLSLKSVAIEMSGPGEAGARITYRPFLPQVRKIRELKERGLDDEDNLQEARGELATRLKELKVIADDTPLWLRRRVVTLASALALGEPFPAPPRASGEESLHIRAWIGDLESEHPDVREAAIRSLLKSGEVAQPQLREALANGASKTVESVKRILGIGHAPWTGESKPTQRLEFGNQIREYEAIRRSK